MMFQNEQFIHEIVGLAFMNQMSGRTLEGFRHLIIEFMNLSHLDGRQRDCGTQSLCIPGGDRKSEWILRRWPSVGDIVGRISEEILNQLLEMAHTQHFLEGKIPLIKLVFICQFLDGPYILSFPQIIGGETMLTHFRPDFA